MSNIKQVAAAITHDYRTHAGPAKAERARAALAPLSPDQREAVYTLLPAGVEQRLARGLRTPELRARHCAPRPGITIEGGPQQQALARRVIDKMAASPRVCAALERKQLTIVITPEGVRVRDLPEPIYRRKDDSIVGNATPWRVVSESDPDTLAHELAHWVQFHAMTLGERVQLGRLFRKARAEVEAGERKGGYALTSKWEYFAEATASYFGEKRTTLRADDPALYLLLLNLYGVIP